jgi:predicted  nucleic acid-binding Zn-ribbon protein
MTENFICLFCGSVYLKEQLKIFSGCWCCINCFDLYNKEETEC